MAIKLNIPDFKRPEPTTTYVLWTLHEDGQQWYRVGEWTDRQAFVDFVEHYEASHIVRVTERRAEYVEIFWPALLDEISNERSLMRD